MSPEASTTQPSVGRVLLLTLFMLLPAAADAQAPPPAPQEQQEQQEQPAYKISGLVYGDYYYVAASHREELEGLNGFWIRRLYLTYDHALAKSLSIRARLEANGRGDFKSTGVHTPYVKDLWLRWSFGTRSLTFGMAPTANIDFVDTWQGYRAVEKNPLDLYRWDSARDLGVIFQGGLGQEARTRYTFQFGNGSGTGSEVDQSKSLRGQLVHRFASGLALEGYADWQDRPGASDVSTLEAFVGWQQKSWRASLQYGHQDRRDAGPGGSDLSLELVSAFGVARVSPRVSLVGRLDWHFDPIPDGETIDYVPFSDRARAAFGYVAVALDLHKNVQLIPTVLVAAYREADDGTTPGTDVMPRVTLFFSW